MTNATNNTITPTRETKVRIFWAEANDSTVVKRTMKDSDGEDFSFASLDEFNGYFWNQRHEDILAEVYERQGNNTEGRKLFPCQYTLSIGDVIEIVEDTKESQEAFTAPDCTVYIVSRVGFIKIQVNEDDELFEQWRNSTCSERILMARKLYTTN